MASDHAARVARRAWLRRRRRRRRATLLALAALGLVAAVSMGSAFRGSRGGSSPAVSDAAPSIAADHPRPARKARPSPRSGRRISSVPILMYHVINAAPPHAPFRGLYVPPAEFARQMQALAAVGYRGVTLDEVAANWQHGTPLPPGRPVVISFDNGYRSQYTAALPVLERLGWPAVENLQLSGLPPSQGGLSTREVRELVHAGWELDTQGFTHADLPTLGAAQLRHEVRGARLLIRRRFHVPVHWFCYPSGLYDPAVIAAVRSAGYSGATTVIPGWATISDDPYRLPRLRVLRGTTPSSLLSQVAAMRDSPPPPAAYG